jgi:hypothetical protein
MDMRKKVAPLIPGISADPLDAKLESAAYGASVQRSDGEAGLILHLERVVASAILLMARFVAEP